MKCDQARVVRDHTPAAPAADLLLHTDSGLRLTPARQVEELPPEFDDAVTHAACRVQWNWKFNRITCADLCLPCDIQESKPSHWWYPALIVIFKRPSGRWENTRGHILLSDVDPFTGTGAPPHTQDTGSLTEQIDFLRVELQMALRAQREPDARARATMKGEQTCAVREHTPATPAADMLFHTGSGLRLTPARQVEKLPPEYST
ncbi:hypothetical protein DFH09DRAFT_1301703 [Mycena vulgaris]|nr:hypothetical protein DFH09DRAFT_1301703 [Mycena vulgaris]